MRAVRFVIVMVTAAPLVIAGPAIAQVRSSEPMIEGIPSVIDGDTIEIGGRRVRLHAVDAPELDQLCERAGREWRCGMEAGYALANLIESHWVTCRAIARGAIARDDGQPMVAVCRMGGPKGIDINEEIVRRGWALVSRQADGRYVAAEREARSAGTGLWSGTFAPPWKWRRAGEPDKPDD